MKLLFVFFLCACMLTPVLRSAEPASREWPLWDGQESISEYATRVNLPPSKTIDLGNNVKLELVLIPAWSFKGAQTPVPVDYGAYRKSILTYEALLGVGTAALVVLLLWVVVRARLNRKMPQFSLLLLLILVGIAGIGLYGAIRWRQTVQDFERAIKDYEKKLTEFEKFPKYPFSQTEPIYFDLFEVSDEEYLQVLATDPSSKQKFANKNGPQLYGYLDEFCQKVKASTGENLHGPTQEEWLCAIWAAKFFYGASSLRLALGPHVVAPAKP